MDFDFNIDGFDAVLDRMKQMADQDVVDGAVLGGLRNGGRLVQQTAKALCPVGDTGQLQNSIVVEDIPDQVGVDVGSNVEHSVYVELGTGLRGDEANIPAKNVLNPRYTISKRHECKDESINGESYPYLGMEPQPYLYPALEAHKEDIVNEVKEAVRQVMKKW